MRRKTARACPLDPAVPILFRRRKDKDRAPRALTLIDRGQMPRFVGIAHHIDGAEQAAWTTRGTDAFSFEIVEQIEEEEIAYVRERSLKERLAHWQSVLDAVTI